MLKASVFPLLVLGCSLLTGGMRGQERTRPPVEIRSGLIGAHSTRAIAGLIPAEPEEKSLFHSYPVGGKGVVWSDSWVAGVDLTGVAWDRPQAGVLVTPEHVVFAAHMGRDRSTPIHFHDRKGRLVERMLGDFARLVPAEVKDGPDLLVMRLNEPVPESIHTYRLLPPIDRWRTSLRGDAALYTDQERKLMVTRISGIAGGIIRFGKNYDFDDFYQEELVGGDSANPSFLLVNGEPVLIETHTFGGRGAGPFFSDPEVFRLLDAAVVSLGGKYQLATIPLVGVPARPVLRPQE